MNNEIDIRPILPSIRVPTLIIHRSADRTVNVEAGRYMAAQVPGARYVELPGKDHLPFFGDQNSILDEVERFLTGARSAEEPNRALLTLLVVEVVGPKTSSAPLSDREWRDRVDAYHQLARKELSRFRGREVEAAVGRFLASFDGPARAISCACALTEAAQVLELEVRAGLHTGECELAGGRVEGLIVHMAGRVMACAAPGEVVVSNTVRDLVAGSGLRFEDLGGRSNLGTFGQWSLHRVARTVARRGRSARETTLPRGRLLSTGCPPHA